MYMNSYKSKLDCTDENLHPEKTKVINHVHECKVKVKFVCGSEVFTEISLIHFIVKSNPNQLQKELQYSNTPCCRRYRCICLCSYAWEWVFAAESYDTYSMCRPSQCEAACSPVPTSARGLFMSANDRVLPPRTTHPAPSCRRSGFTNH